jgi:hypothetical protein
MQKPKQPKTLDLSVFGEFKASHSLTGFEVPHFHLWKVTVDFKTDLPIPGDRLIDLVFLQNILTSIFHAVEGKHLNAVLAAPPTSENVASWVWDEVVRTLPEAPLAEVSVTLCDLDGKATGRARLRG